MRQLILFLALVLSSRPVSAGEQPLVPLSAAQVFHDLASYGGRDVLIADGEVVFASTHGALLRGGDDIFFELKPDMDAEVLRSMIASCSGPKGSRPDCRMPVTGHLLPNVSPTTGWPILAHARIPPR